MQDRLASRDEIRDQNQQERQDRRDDVREDWHDRYDDIYDRHEDWHHGHWDDAGDWWDHMWDDHTALMAFGATMWGVNRAAYGFGYWGYENPYYTESYPIDAGYAIDYSQPIAIDSQPVAIESAPVTATQSIDAPAPGISEFEQARQAFYQADYASALASTNKALAALPNDPIIHEFRALVMFAQGKYKEAAAGLYSVLSVGPGWDWTTLSSLYPSVDVYTQQLRTLEQYLREHPDDSAARFVLAYQYLTTKNKEAAAGQLKELYKQQPQDELVKQLLVMTAGPEAIGAAPAASDTAAAAVTTIPAADLIGKWNARGESDTAFAMELTQDGNFSWTFTQRGKPQSVKGVYALDGNVLAMEPETGGVMLAEVSPPQAGSFSFHLLGAPPGDPGLKFAKSN